MAHCEKPTGRGLLFGPLAGKTRIVRTKLGVGVVGAGQIAHYACAELARHPDARVVGAAEPNAERLGQLCDKFSIPYATGDAAALFAREDVDAVYIATPNAFHAELAIAALDQ